MKVYSTFCTILLLLIITLNIQAQDTKTDVINLRHLGEIKGKVIRIKENSVEFRIAKNNLIFDYPKSEINYIALANGDWISFNEYVDSLSINNNPWSGYFNLSGGISKLFEKGESSDIWKPGFEFSGDLNFKTGKYYSIGFIISYSSMNLDENNFLITNNYSLSDSASVSGGNVNILRFGLINRIFPAPSSVIEPVVTIIAGFANLLTSQIDVEAKSGNISIGSSSNKGFTIGTGLGIFIHTGETAGILVTADYNWIFYGSENIRFGTAALGYSLPIN